jgi:hypothetical protein
VPDEEEARTQTRHWRLLRHQAVELDMVRHSQHDHLW